MASKSTPLPDKSNPEYYKNTDVSKQVKGNLKKPLMPEGAKQVYNKQYEQYKYTKKRELSFNLANDLCR